MTGNPKEGGKNVPRGGKAGRTPGKDKMVGTRPDKQGRGPLPGKAGKGPPLPKGKDDDGGKKK